MSRFIVGAAITAAIGSLVAGLASAVPALAAPPNIPPGDYLVYEYKAGGGEHDPYRWRFTPDCGPGCLRATAVDLGWSVDLHEGSFERIDGTIVPSWARRTLERGRPGLYRRRQAQHGAVQPDLDLHRRSHGHGFHALDAGDQFVLRGDGGHEGRPEAGPGLTPQTRRFA